MNKYLVILAGSPRGGERTYSSLYKRVCEYLSADLAICTSIDKVDEEISLFKKADYKWILDIQDDFSIMKKIFTETGKNTLKMARDWFI